MRKLFKVIFVIIALLIIIFILPYFFTKSKLTNLKNIQISGVDLATSKDGNYTGTFSAIPIEAEAQSLQVDTISGATYSSKVILKAIENALKESIK